MNSINKSILNLIIARLDGDKLGDNSYRGYLEKLTKDGISGFILFGGKFEEVEEFLFNLQKLSNKKLIISSDIERGVGQQIEGTTLIPSQMGIAAGFDLETDYQELVAIYSRVIGEVFKVGINLALIPVLDLNTDEDNPIICTRAFSDNVDIVSKYGKFLIELFESKGLPTCAKHFPGHGPTKIDSHLDLPEIKEDIGIHLKPFKEAIKSNVSSIMVGHLLVPELDKKPASLSEKIINELLRKELLFDGVIVSDAMNMKALKDYENPYEMALKAGIDIILHPEDPYEAAEKIRKAYEIGKLPEKRIIEANKKVEELRKKIVRNLLNRRNTYGELSDINPIEIFKKTVTVIKSQKINFDHKNISVYLVGSYRRKVLEFFEKKFKKVYEIKETMEIDTPALVAIFTEIGFGKRNSINEEEQNLIKRVLKKGESILVSFGNPYVLKPFTEASTVVAVYDSHEIAVQAFIDVFNSGLKTKAKIPVRINWIDD